MRFINWAKSRLITSCAVLAVAMATGSSSLQATTTAKLPPVTSQVLAQAGAARAPSTAGREANVVADRSATIRVGYPSAINSLDPHASTGEAITLRWLWGIYDRLFTIDSEGKIRGLLVKDWSYSADGRTLTLNLRDNVKFDDGTPLNAEAVHVSLERARTGKWPVVTARLREVTGVTVTGPLQVQLSLSRAAIEIPHVLAEMAGYIMHPGLIANGDPAKQVNGSGPYRLVKFVPGESMTIERKNTAYWDPAAAQVKTFVLTSYPDPTAQVNAMVSGQIDLGMYMPNQFPSLKGNSDLKIEKIQQGIGIDLGLNWTKPPLNNTKLRQAIALAIDRQGIADAFFPGSFAKTQFMRKGLVGFDANIGRTIRYDPTAAKALLAQAGHPNGVDIGTVLVSATVPAGVTDVIKQQLSAIGVQATFEVVDALQINGRYGKGTANGAINIATSGTSPFTLAMYLFVSPLKNPGGTTPEFDSLLGRFTNLATPAEEDRLAKELDRYVVDAAWVVPIVLYVNYWAMKPEIFGQDQSADFSTTVGPFDLRYIKRSSASPGRS